MYLFQQPPDIQFVLWRKDGDGNPLKKIALCQKLVPTDKCKCRWKVIEVFAHGIKEYVAGVKLPASTGPPAQPLFLEWKSESGPKSFTFVNESEMIHDSEIAAMSVKEKVKWENLKAAIPVTVLPLIKWHAASKHEKDILYGMFRNKLLHDPTTLKILNKYATMDEHSQVYVHITDPDTQSLRVCIHSNFDPETEDDEHSDTDIYQAYKRYIHEHYTNRGVYPALMSIYFKFTTDQLGMNRIFILNKELNSIMHTNLPSAAYLSECNTVLQYDPNYWESLHFNRKNNEIIPIVQRMVDLNLSVLIRDGA